MGQVKKNERLHAGHRDRMRNKYLLSGPDAFENHELLEILLYYCVPQKDTNELAHNLLNHFGSLEGVFSASPEELGSIPYIKKNASVLISLVREINRRREMEKLQKSTPFKTKAQIDEYLLTLYNDLSIERLYALLFDNSMRLIECVAVSDGTVNATNINVRTIVERALFKRASNVVIAHNHPEGRPIPSKHDIAATHDMDAALRIMGINLVDHFLVADGKCVSLRNFSTTL